MNKVTISERQAEAIERLRADSWSNSDILISSVSGFDKADNQVLEYDVMDIEILSKALIVGYEVETPEWKVRKYMRELGSQKVCDECGKNEYQAILNVFRILGITIEGVNN